MKALIITSAIALAGLFAASNVKADEMVTKVCHVRAFVNYDTRHAQYDDDRQTRATIRDFGDGFVINYADALMNVMSPNLTGTTPKGGKIGFATINNDRMAFVADKDGTYTVFTKRNKWAFLFHKCEVVS